MQRDKVVVGQCDTNGCILDPWCYAQQRSFIVHELRKSRPAAVAIKWEVSDKSTTSMLVYSACIMEGLDLMLCPRTMRTARPCLPNQDDRLVRYFSTQCWVSQYGPWYAISSPLTSVSTETYVNCNTLKYLNTAEYGQGNPARYLQPLLVAFSLPVSALVDSISWKVPLCSCLPQGSYEI